MNQKNYTKKNYKLIAVIIMIAGLATSAILLYFHFRQPENPNDIPQYTDEFSQKVELLREKLPYTESLIEYDRDFYGYTVFISVSDSKNRATVTIGNGETLEAAFDASVDKAWSEINASETIEPVWLKSDAVINIEPVLYEDFARTAEETQVRSEFMRAGISFDRNFSVAVLETEINANTLWNYSEHTININRVKNYLKSQNRESPSKVPDEIFLFAAQGFFVDENNEVFELYNDGYEVGRRKMDYVDKETALETLRGAADFLQRNVQDNGQFVYGYRPITGAIVSSYNILRHTGAIWSLISYYDATGDESVKPYIDKTLDYLQEQVVYKDENTAYILEEKNGELKLGGNGIATFTLVRYMEVFDTDKYTDLILTLGNGIIELQNDDGSYWHVIQYPDFNRTEEYRTVYYDGEATYGLAAIYGFTGQQKYLDSAVKAVDYFIENDYTKHADHWVSYSINELTKHVKDEKYFEFGLKNAYKNIDKIYFRDTTYHTYNELLMAAFELYDRITTENIQVAYLEEFDSDKFLDTIYYRIWHMYNGLFLPEYVMYFDNIETHIGNFFVRHDKFRERIDDTQHFFSGLYVYYINYERLSAYKEPAVVKPYR